MSIVIEKVISVQAVAPQGEKCPACRRKVKDDQKAVRVKGIDEDGVEQDHVLHQRCFANSLTEE